MFKRVPIHARWILLVAVFLVMAAEARAGRKIFTGEGVEIEIVLEPKGEARHGYAEHIFLVVNNSDRARRIELVLPAEGGGRGDSAIREIRRGVEVEPSGSTHLTLYQPAFPFTAGAGLVVYLDGKAQDPPIDLTIRNVSRPDPTSGSPIRMPGLFGQLTKGLVLVGPAVDPLLVETLRSQRIAIRADSGVDPRLPPGTRRPPSRGISDPERTLQHFEAITHDAPLRSWSDQWLGYSRYDAIILTAGDLAGLPESVRIALWQYVECGGVLLIVGPAKLSEGWKFRDRFAWKIAEPGFGLCLVATPTYAGWTEDLKQLFRSACSDTSAGFKDLPSNQINHSFPIVEEIGIPIRGLFVLMVVFVVVIGPVNLTLLSRWKRRLWLLWTVPVISGATVAAVFGYMLVAEGWDRHQRTDVITIKDEATGRATTLGWTAFYCPVTPGDGLRFSYDTELTLQGEYDNQFHYRHGSRGRGSRSCSLNWTRTQHLENGWMRARLPTHFQVRKSERVRRDRVLVRKNKDGSYSATNALGVAIRKLHFADEQGRIHLVESIPAGAEQKMKLTDTKPVVTGELLRPLFTGNWLDAARKLRQTPTTYLGPLTYLAEVEDTPFLEDGLTNTVHRRCGSVILGLLKDLDHES